MWSVHWLALLLATIFCLLCDRQPADAVTLRYYYYRSYTQRSLARYYRAYFGVDLGSFRWYQARYSYYVRFSTYYVRTRYYSTRKCGNFEANTYGDYIGFFDCPLSFEWRNASYCCGKQGSHYCCDQSSKDTRYTSDPNSSTSTSSTTVTTIWMWYIYIAIVIGGLIGLGLLIALIVGLLICCGVVNRKKSKPNTVRPDPRSYPTQPNARTQVPVGSYPGQPAPYPNAAQYPPAAPPAGPPPPYPPAGPPPAYPPTYNDVAYPPPNVYNQQQ